jgi:GGDEF domain-containing protein
MFLQRILGRAEKCRVVLALVLASLTWSDLTLADGSSSAPVNQIRPAAPAGIKSFGVMSDVPASWTLAEVLAEPRSRFAAFDPEKIYPVSSDRAMWLHFQMAARAFEPTTAMVFEYQTPYVDAVQFYSQNEQGKWIAQTAGKLTQRADWPLRGLFPRFELPPARAEVQDIYVRVQNFLPIRTELAVRSFNESNHEMQQKVFSYGLGIGILALMCIYGVVLALTYRHAIYAWFSLYAGLANVSSANYVGLPNYIEGLDFPNWSGSSVIVSATAVALVKLKFCYAIFSDELSSRWINYGVWFSLVISMLCIAGLLALPYGDLNKRLLFFMAFGICTLMLLTIICLAIYKGSTIGWLWLAGFTPVTVLLLLTAVDATGLAAFAFLPFGGLVYARTFEVIVLLFAMQLHVKSMHSRLVRSTTLEELDPLTGFLAAQQYPDTLAHLWSQARSNQEDLAVAYIRAVVGFDEFQAANQPSDDALAMRCVRMLRMVVRQDDIVARIDKNVFAILMPRVSTGPNFADKLARRIALGGMHDTDDSAHIPVKFQIVATTFRCFKSTSGQLNEALWKKLNMMALTNGKAIEFIEN